jgi:hypothetical protein
VVGEMAEVAAVLMVIVLVVFDTGICKGSDIASLYIAFSGTCVVDVEVLCFSKRG